MKIGLFGGSFDPIQNAHMADIQKVLSANLVDKVWIMPCGKHAFEKSLTPAEYRLDMIRLAIGGMEDVEIEYSELYSCRKNYTADTLRRLKSQHGHDFCLIAGSDILGEVERWKDFDYIRQIPFIVIKREGYDYSEKNLRLEAFLEDNQSSVSSSEIRKRIMAAESVTGLVPRAVERYIHKNHLYSTMKYDNPACAVDVIIPMFKNGRMGIPLVKRKNNPFKGCWAFVGGFLNTYKETLEECASRETLEEIGLKIKPKDIESIRSYSDVSRDPRGHVISHVFEALKYSGELIPRSDAEEVKVFYRKPKNMAFDHARIWDEYFCIGRKNESVFEYLMEYDERSKRMPFS